MFSSGELSRSSRACRRGFQEREFHAGNTIVQFGSKAERLEGREGETRVARWEVAAKKQA